MIRVALADEFLEPRRRQGQHQQRLDHALQQDILQRPVFERLAAMLGLVEPGEK
jgi:hypothetical protein